MIHFKTGVAYMRWKETRNNLGYESPWTRWFAWYPVDLDNNDTVWFESIERCYKIERVRRFAATSRGGGWYDETAKVWYYRNPL